MRRIIEAIVIARPSLLRALADYSASPKLATQAPISGKETLQLLYRPYLALLRGGVLRSGSAAPAIARRDFPLGQLIASPESSGSATSL